MSSSATVLLRPRPYAQDPAVLLLLPLLSTPKVVTLPSELWLFIFQLVAAQSTSGLLPLLTVCRNFKDLLVPVLYSDVQLRRLPAFQKFYSAVHRGDQTWSALHRNPLSAPGRWVRYLDLSTVVITGQEDALVFESLLTALFPNIPLMTHLALCPSQALGRRALLTLAEREPFANGNIRAVTGISYPRPWTMSTNIHEDPLVTLVSSCPNLEELEVIANGDPVEVDPTIDLERWTASNTPLALANLQVLSLLSLHFSPLLLAVLFSPLPALQRLRVTPYDDIPYPASLISQLIAMHGRTLQSLSFITPKSWPTRLHPSPPSVLHDCPRLQSLSLEKPLPTLMLSHPHPLRTLTVPRPTPEAWEMIQKILPHLPELRAIRARDVRWLRGGMTKRALEAGVQGEMWEWSRRLSRLNMTFVDADWKRRE